MDYNELVITAIKRNEMMKLLCGEKPYEVEVSKFTSDVFPTDINAVLVNCIYKQISNIDNISYMFEHCLYEMLEKNASKAYTAILYFDACIFQEERGKSTFSINKETFISKIREAVEKFEVDWENTISFDNGMKKNNAMKNIQNFDKYYQKKYGFSIIDQKHMV